MQVYRSKSLILPWQLKLVESSRLLGEEIEKLNMRIENTPKELWTLIEKQKRQLQEKKASYNDEEVKAQGMFEKRKVLEGLEMVSICDVESETNLISCQGHRLVYTICPRVY